jgi:hypothetical protein
MPGAQEHLWNYLSDGAKSAVKAEVLDSGRDTDKLDARPRIFEDLLSSQPLCFNLFGELKANIALATAVCSRLWPDRVDRVTAVDFEFSPGRGDPTYLGNRSALDVMISCVSPRGTRGFLGIEVKYHEDLRVGAATHRARYDEVATSAGAFHSEALAELREPPLQQLWLDHLLTLSMVQAGWADEGTFVLLHPAGNMRCSTVAERYADCLAETSTFHVMTMEQVVERLAHHTTEPWVAAFQDRYLAFDKVDALEDP